jgi:hypothetical protein
VHPGNGEPEREVIERALERALGIQPGSVERHGAPRITAASIAVVSSSTSGRPGHAAGPSLKGIT